MLPGISGACRWGYIQEEGSEESYINCRPPYLYCFASMIPQQRLPAIHIRAYVVLVFVGCLYLTTHVHAYGLFQR